jgi:hypothetical protein
VAEEEKWWPFARRRARSRGGGTILIRFDLFVSWTFFLDPARLDRIRVKRLRRCDIRATCICIGLHTLASLVTFFLQGALAISHLHPILGGTPLDFPASSSLLDSALQHCAIKSGARDGGLHCAFIWIPNRTDGLGTTAFFFSLQHSYRLGRYHDGSGHKRVRAAIVLSYCTFFEELILHVHGTCKRDRWTRRIGNRSPIPALLQS